MVETIPVAFIEKKGIYCGETRDESDVAKKNSDSVF